VATYESGLRKTFHMADMPAEARPRGTAGPGGRVRFAVFAPDGRRSMAWTVGTTRRTRDVYITARSLGGTWKMSLHQSGRWNSGLTAERAVAMAPPIPDRHWDQWQQPAEFAPGIRRSVELVFADVELRRWPAGLTDDKPVTVIPAPGDGYAACVDFIFLAPGPPLRLDIDQAFNVAAIDLHDLTKLSVVAHQIPWVAEDVEWLLVAKRAMVDSLNPAVIRAARAPRTILMGKHTDDPRFVVDYAPDLGPVG
jgi:hypothetical protein